MIFSHRVLNCIGWAVFSEQIKFVSISSLRKWGGWTQSYSLSHWKVAVCYSSSVKIQLQEKLIYARSKSNHMLTVFHLPSLFETYKTMWFRLCFLSKAGGEFPSGLCVARTLFCLIWLVIKISGKLHGKFVLTDSSHGLGSPGGSSRGKEVGASSQMRTIKARGG